MIFLSLISNQAQVLGITANQVLNESIEIFCLFALEHTKSKLHQKHFALVWDLFAPSTAQSKVTKISK